MYTCKSPPGVIFGIEFGDCRYFIVSGIVVSTFYFIIKSKKVKKKISNKDRLWAKNLKKITIAFRNKKFWNFVLFLQVIPYTASAILQATAVGHLSQAPLPSYVRHLADHGSSTIL